jgi:hypothetical protein
MSTTKRLLNRIPPEAVAELEAAADRLARGVHDPEITRQACERMDQAREEIRQKHGELNVAVALIRDARNQR